MLSKETFLRGLYLADCPEFLFCRAECDWWDQDMPARYTFDGGILVMAATDAIVPGYRFFKVSLTWQTGHTCSVVVPGL